MGHTMVKKFEDNASELACQKHPIIASTMITVFTFAVFLTFGLLYGIIFTETAKVMTKEGPIEGFFVRNVFERNVKVFYGVPYAEPPIGDLRFMKPMPKKPWNESIKAIKQPNACPQAFDGIKNLIIDSIWKEMQSINISEDCLYLNIYVPAAKDKNRKRLEHCQSNYEIKTVMVYFHGGSFQYGSNSFKFFDATRLAAFGDVIVVVPNYRIGILGFLSSQPHINGNFGLFDQLEALKWVQRNIAAFGGNPDNVVLFGQNAGAVSIALHLMSPLSKNLFKRAILESGNSLSMLTVLGPENAKDFTIKVANTSNCPFITKIGKDETETYLINKTTINCLRNIPSQKLIEIQNKILAKVPISLFTPVVDREFLIEPTLDLVDNYKFGPYSEILIGSNAMEGVSILSSLADKQNIHLEKMRRTFTKRVIKKFLLKRAPASVRGYIDMGLTEAFPDYELDVNNSTQMWFRFVKIVGDLLQVCSDEHFIGKFTESGRNIYYYQFMHKPSIPLLFKSKNWFNMSDNFDETPFVFGYPLIETKLFNNQEISLSKKLMRFWTNFAKRGNPTESNYWPIFDISNPQYLSLDVNSIKIENKLKGFKCDPYFTMFYNAVKGKLGEINLKTLNLMEKNKRFFLE